MVNEREIEQPPRTRGRARLRVVARGLIVEGTVMTGDPRRTEG